MVRKILAVLMLLATVATAQEINLKFLDEYAGKAKSKTVIDLGPEQLATMSSLAGNDQNMAAALAAVKGLKTVQVRTFEFDKPGVINKGMIEELRSQFKKSLRCAPFIRSEEDGEVNEIYLCGGNDKEQTQIGVLSIGDKELNVVYVKGLVSLDSLSKLGALSNLGNIGSASGGGDGKLAPSRLAPKAKPAPAPKAPEE